MTLTSRAHLSTGNIINNGWIVINELAVVVGVALAMENNNSHAHYNEGKDNGN